MTKMRRWLIPVAVALLLFSAVANAFDPLFASAGAPIYPDLRTASPGDPYIERRTMADGRVHYLLRFDNTVENHGGRLEIVADLERSRDLYQNVYDARAGGNLVEHERIDSDLIFHSTHNHFHFKSFAGYSLVKKNTRGVYRRTGKTGKKTSFCILDTAPVAGIPRVSSSYTTCNARRQGLSSGWSDVYTANLSEQWIDLGTSPPSDGEYGIQSVADPTDRIRESDEHNNLAVAFFSIRNGALTEQSARPYCGSKPESAPVGAEVVIVCDRLSPGERYDVRWRYPSSDPITNAQADANGDLTAAFVMPPSTRGAHYAYLSSRDSEKYILAVVDTLPTFTIEPTSGVVGSTVSFRLTGFNDDEPVSVRYQQADGLTKTVANVTTDGQGNAAGSAVVPSSAVGPHRIELTGSASQVTVGADFTVIPTLLLQPGTAAPGGLVGPRLRGFGSRELVRLSIQETGAVQKSVRVSTTGAADARSSTQFRLPVNLAAGTYAIVATGQTSGATASSPLTVSGAAQAAIPTPVPTPPVVPTGELTPSATATVTASPAPTDAPTVAPTEPPPPPTAEPTAPPAPTDVPPPPPAETPPAA